MATKPGSSKVADARLVSAKGSKTKKATPTAKVRAKVRKIVAEDIVRWREAWEELAKR